MNKRGRKKLEKETTKIIKRKNKKEVKEGSHPMSPNNDFHFESTKADMIDVHFVVE